MNNKSKWGSGIPKYSNDDLMNSDDVYLFSMQIIGDYLKQNKYEILFAERRTGVFPSFIAKKDSKEIAILVEGVVVPKKAKLLLSNKYMMNSYSKKEKIDSYFAGVGIGSADSERFDKGLALKEDGYYVDFKGLEKVEIKIPIIGTEEYYVYLFQELLNAIFRKNTTVLSHILTKDCILNNKISKEDKTGLDNVKEYLQNELVDLTPNGNCLVKTKGMFGEVAVKELHVKEEIISNAKVKILQEPDKLMLLVSFKEHIFNSDIGDAVINCDINSDGLINKITISDPRLLSFESYKY